MIAFWTLTLIGGVILMVAAAASKIKQKFVIE